MFLGLWYYLGLAGVALIMAAVESYRKDRRKRAHGSYDDEDWKG